MGILILPPILLGPLKNMHCIYLCNSYGCTGCIAIRGQPLYRAMTNSARGLPFLPLTSDVWGWGGGVSLPVDKSVE